MNTHHNTRGKAGRSAAGKGSTRLDRAVTEVAWYTPELTVAVATGGAATVWPPFALATVAAVGWIATDNVLRVRSNRAAKRKAARIRADQARLDRAAETAPPLPPADGERRGQGEVSA